MLIDIAAVELWTHRAQVDGRFGLAQCQGREDDCRDWRVGKCSNAKIGDVVVAAFRTFSRLGT